HSQKTLSKDTLKMNNNARRLVGPPPKPPTHFIFHEANPMHHNKLSSDIHFQSLRTAIQDDKLEDEVLLRVVLFGYHSYAIMAENSQSAKQKYQKIIDTTSLEKATDLVKENQVWAHEVMDLWEEIDRRFP
ncbi:hypothetical protein IL306_005683, partial [Fusarium sp. DS 682]